MMSVTKNALTREDDSFIMPIGMTMDCDDHWSVDELFYFKDCKKRRLYLTGEVEETSVGEIIKMILRYNDADRDLPLAEREPIKLYISSSGGSVDSGFALIDVIQASITPVYTINIGGAFSMAFLIEIAGAERFTYKNAKFLMHDGSFSVYNSGAKAQDMMEFQMRSEKRIKDYILSHTSITEEEYDANQRVEWYMFAEDAKEKGCVDYIIGEDYSPTNIL